MIYFPFHSFPTVSPENPSNHCENISSLPLFYSHLLPLKSAFWFHILHLTKIILQCSKKCGILRNKSLVSQSTLDGCFQTIYTKFHYSLHHFLIYLSILQFHWTRISIWYDIQSVERNYLKKNQKTLVLNKVSYIFLTDTDLRKLSVEEEKEDQRALSEANSLFLQASTPSVESSTLVVGYWHQGRPYTSGSEQQE